MTTRAPSRRSSPVSPSGASTSAFTDAHHRRRARRALPRPRLERSRRARGTLAGGDGNDRIVAIGEYDRLRDPVAAEAAFAVADTLQGHGIGTRLLERLAALAADQGIERFLAEVLPDNRAMLGVFAGAGSR